MLFTKTYKENEIATDKNIKKYGKVHDRVFPLKISDLHETDPLTVVRISMDCFPSLFSQRSTTIFLNYNLLDSIYVAYIKAFILRFIVWRILFSTINCSENII